MTNKLVVVTINLKVLKTEKFLLYKMKFLVPNYSCLQKPWLVGYQRQILVFSVLCPQLKLFKLPNEQKSWVRHCTNMTGNFTRISNWRRHEFAINRFCVSLNILMSLRATISQAIIGELIVALPLQQWLPTRHSALRHLYIAYIKKTIILREVNIWT